MTTVTIVGAGLGGLCAALALADAGLEVQVHEQARALGEVGAGLTVSRGAQAVFARLGVLDAVLQRASVVRSNAFLHYRTGELLDGAHDFTDGWAGDDTAAGTRNVHIHRADLHEILAAALVERAPRALRLGRRLVSVTDRGRDVVAGFVDAAVPGGAGDAGGPAQESVTDLLIGADGLRSAVRRLLWGDEHPAFTGQVAFRCLVPGRVAAPFVEHIGRAAVYFGPGRVFNRYALRGGRIVNCVAIARTDSWCDEGWNIPATAAELTGLYQGWHPDVLGLMRSAPAGQLTKWALYDREPLAQWGRDRVTLLGDAAHPMLPFLGLGSAMAIEDAFVLGQAVAADPSPAGLARYEALRRPRTREIMLASRREGQLVQARDPAQFDAAAAPSRNADFYDFDPAAVTV